MNNLSIIILHSPNGEKDRDNNFNFIYPYMQSIFPNAEFVIADDPTSEPYFCRSHTINHGVRQSTKENLIIMDNDIYLSKELLLQGLELLETSPFVIPFGIIKDLIPPVCDSITSGEPHNYNELVNYSYMDRDIRQDKMAGGLQIFKRQFFNEIGGYDERIKRWGYEDSYMCQKAKHALGDYPIIEDGIGYHLFHPRKQDWSYNKEFYYQLLEELHGT